ncbi:TolC family protein [Bryobacter aggregatus]|uniref:TolC family protein n=1 Tax=Bryobacter aggregatus TaxID=360054 RepID=UPI0009B5B878|nr:TolC family protein [Bryobacter aggregatus]
MKTLRESLAVLCLALTLTTSTSFAQEHTGFVSKLDDKTTWLTKNYRPRDIAPVKLGNSNRLEQLLRAGVIYLSLQDAIALTLENNIDIEIQRYGPELAQTDLLRAQAGGQIRGVATNVTQGSNSAINLVTGGAGTGSGGTSTGNASTTGTVFQVTGAAIPSLDPSFFTSYTHAKQSSPQTNSFVSGISALVLNSDQFNTGIQKQFLTGTTTSITYGSTSTSSNSPNNDLNPFTRNNVQAQITQRLLQGFGLAVNNRNIRVAKNNLKVADLTFKLQVITTVSSVINLYWDLVSFNEDVKVKQKAVDVAAKLYTDQKKQVEIGTIAPIEVVRAEAEVARTEQDLTVSQTQLLQQEAIIKNSLSRSGIASPAVADARIIPTDQIRVPAADIAMAPVSDLVADALANRPEIAQTKLTILNTKIGLAGSRNALLPSLDVSASTTNNGLAGTKNPLSPRFVDPFIIGGYGTALEQLLRRNFPDYSVGFNLNIPIFNRAARADYANDTLRLRQSELQEVRQINSIRLEITNAVIALQQARARHDAAVKSRRLQEQTLEAEQKKYALGSSTTFLVIQAQRDLATAQGVEVTALANYSRARNQMDVAAGRLLEANSISIEEAVKGSVSRLPTTLP